MTTECKKRQKLKQVGIVTDNPGGNKQLSEEVIGRF